MKRNRVDAVLDRLEQMGLEQLVITDATSIFYLTGIWVDAGERLVALYLSRHRGLYMACSLGSGTVKIADTQGQWFGAALKIGANRVPVKC